MRSLFISCLVLFTCKIISGQCRLIIFEEAERSALLKNNISAVRVYKVSDSVKALVKKALIDEEGCCNSLKENFYQNSYNIWNASESSRNNTGTQRRLLRYREENGRSVIVEDELEEYSRSGKMMERKRTLYGKQIVVSLQKFDTLDAEKLSQWTTVLDSLSNDTIKKSSLIKNKEQSIGTQDTYEHGVIVLNQSQVTKFENGKWKEVLTYKNGQLIEHKRADEMKNGKPKPGDGTLVPKPIPRYDEGKKDSLYTDHPEEISFITTKNKLKTKKAKYLVVVTYQYNDNSIIERLEVVDTKKGLPVKKLYPTMRQLFLFEYDHRN